MPTPMRGPLRHLLLTLRLNFRSPQALVYGYLVPLFFLIAFAAIDKTTPPVWHELGALLTITTLGGACFGMPTAMVAERERGLWRRYRLLPGGMGAILLSTVLARLILIASAALLQIGLARLIYHMPMPVQPVQLLFAFSLSAIAFLGLGLVIAMLAGSVPAVQAMGQCIFLPMIIIGGIGVPLSVLPAWAQRVAQFLPGRYAAEAMQACTSGLGLSQHQFDLIALALFGLGGFLAAAKTFRWDAGRSLSPKAYAWAALALLPWAGVGVAASSYGVSPAPAFSAPAVAPAWQSVTLADIDAIQYTGLEPDESTVTPLAPDLDHLSPNRAAELADISRKLDTWPPARSLDPVERLRNLLALAGIADLAEDPVEPYLPLIVLRRMQSHYSTPDVEKILTWIVMHPDGAYPTAAPELGWNMPIAQGDVRQRAIDYARKLVGRLTGRRSVEE